MKIAIVVMNSFFSDGRVERVASTIADEHEVKVYGLHDETKEYPNILPGLNILMFDMMKIKV